MFEYVYNLIDAYTTIIANIQTGINGNEMMDFYEFICWASVKFSPNTERLAWIFFFSWVFIVVALSVVAVVCVAKELAENKKAKSA